MKQRIIGIIVLIALGIIVVPLIFDSEPQSAVPADAMLITEASKQKPVKAELDQETSADTDTDEEVRQAHKFKHKRMKPVVEEDDASAETAEIDEAILHKPVVEAAQKNKKPVLEADLEATEEIVEPAAAAQIPEDKIETSDAEEKPTTKTSLKSSEAKPEHKSVSEPESFEPESPAVTPVAKPSSKHAVINKDIQREIDEEVAEVSSGWAVQAGVFADLDNANELVKRLQKHGFHAFVKVNKTGKKKIARVFIGPEANRNTADKILKTLQNKLHVSGIVVRYRA